MSYVLLWEKLEYIYAAIQAKSNTEIREIIRTWKEKSTNNKKFLNAAENELKKLN